MPPQVGEEPVQVGHGQVLAVDRTGQSWGPARERPASGEYFPQRGDQLESSLVGFDGNLQKEEGGVGRELSQMQDQFHGHAAYVTGPCYRVTRRTRTQSCRFTAM
jgi:hypothetical protein